MTDETRRMTESTPESGNRTQKLLSWILLGGFLLIAGLARGVYAAHGSQPTQRFQLLTTLGLMVLLWYWFVQQMMPYRPRLPMDMGVILVALWFIFDPYYLWRYERWRGLGKVIGLIGLYGLTWVLGVAVAVVLS